MRYPFRDIVFEKCGDVLIVALPISSADLDSVEVDIPMGLARTTLQRRREYIAGRLCAHHAIQRVTGRIVSVGQDEQGLPIWPSDVIGSISHSAGVACAAVTYRSSRGRIGIDIEGVLPQSEVGNILDVCASAKERSAFSSAQSATMLFSAKESYYKAFAEDLGTLIEFTDVIASPLSAESIIRLTLQRSVGLLPTSHTADVHVLVVEGSVVSLVRH